MTISRTFKSVTNSGTFESVTNFFKFFFAFLDDLVNFKHFEPYFFFSKISCTFKSTTISRTFECTTNSHTAEVQALDWSKNHACSKVLAPSV